jgi:predicted PurR-regulated permease PerM
VSTENPEKNTSPVKESPKWNWTTKLVIGLALVAVSAWVLVQFQNFLGPLISALILAYLIHPIASFIKEKIGIPWRLSVTLIYLLLVLVILGLLTWGGFALVEQIQNLIDFIENNIDQLPDLVAQITEQTYQVGPFTFSPSRFNWDEVTNEIVGAIQPTLGRLGSLASSIAAGAFSIVTWTVLILLVSYFLLAESEGIPSRLLNIQIPGYTKDLEIMGRKLSRIWNAFIRGEILVVIFSLAIYSAVLGVLGIQFFFGLALIAAIGQLIPYVGAWATWISFGLVALFQNNIPFDLAPGIYMVIVLGVSMVVNNFIDNILRTKVMATNLKVHPALVLIGALIGVQLFGFVGIVIAAPVMASLKLLMNYIINKLNDQNPWMETEAHAPPPLPKWFQTWQERWKNFTARVRNTWRKLWKKDAISENDRPNQAEEPNSEE